MLQHPARQHGLGSLVDPLIDQDRDFSANICGIVQPSEFKALQQRT
jgi:hypothetical protein